MLRRIISVLSITFFMLGLIAIAAFIYLINYYSHDLPDYKQLEAYNPPTTSRVYSHDGRLIGEFSFENRVFVPFSMIPTKLVKAFIAAEDQNFYSHPGVDYTSVMRAIIQNLLNIGQKKSLVGGSTITQQVVKNFLLTNERSISRKIKEAILAYRITNTYSKDRILELYLNQIYLGNGTYGVATAALGYFNKSLDQLTVAECAFLAGLPKAPSTYHPKNNYQRAKVRRDYVIDRMFKDGIITEEEAKLALNSKIEVVEKSDIKIVKADYFLSEVKKNIIEKYNEDILYKGGLTVITSLDIELQRFAEQALRQGIDNYNKHRGDKEDQINGAIIVMNPRNGQILAMVGGYDFGVSQFNRATQALRQPGSTFKPFIYLSAFESDINPNLIVSDSPVEIYQGPGLPMWKPKNYSGNYLGPITIREGLEKSRNIVTVKLAELIGIKKIAEVAKKFDIYSNPPENFSMVLGANETTLLKMTSAFATIANYGRHAKPSVIEYIQNNMGNTIYRSNEEVKCRGCHLEEINYSNISKKPGIIRKYQSLTDERSAFQMISFLEGVIKRGTAQRAKTLNMHLIGKTGTTNDSKDVWFIGGNQELMVGLYLGYDQPKSLGEKATGSGIALPIFINFMEKAKYKINNRAFLPPEGMAMRNIVYATGQLTAEPANDRSIIKEAFKLGSEPDLYQNEEYNNSDEILDDGVY